MTGVEGVVKGAVVKVTLASGPVQWFGELCDVGRVFLMYGQVTAECASVWTPSITALVPVNERAVELVAPPVSEVSK